jgi:RHS repeat-associated protein
MCTAAMRVQYLCTFDNIQVVHTRSRVLEETHYYPFGLTMAGISSKAMGMLQNRIQFNDGTELNNKEFSDGSGLELYETAFRSYDPQIGRFHQIDPWSEITEDWSPYSFAFDNPISFNDPLGLTSDPEVLPAVTVTPQAWQKHTCYTCGLPAPDPSLALQYYEEEYARPYKWYEFFNDHNPGGDFLYEVNRFNPLANFTNGMWTYFTGHDTYGVPQDNSQGSAQILSSIPISKVAVALETIEVGVSSRILYVTVTQLQKKFKHAVDFGIVGNYNPKKAIEFYSVINQHINAEGTQIVNGAFRNATNDVIFYINPKTGLTVIATTGNQFVSGYKLTVDQINDVMVNKFLW